jgi:hypothetical protein
MDIRPGTRYSTSPRRRPPPDIRFGRRTCPEIVFTEFPDKLKRTAAYSVFLDPVFVCGQFAYPVVFVCLVVLGPQLLYLNMTHSPFGQRVSQFNEGTWQIIYNQIKQVLFKLGDISCARHKYTNLQDKKVLMAVKSGLTTVSGHLSATNVPLFEKILQNLHTFLK